MLQVYGLSFSANAYYLATGGDDNTCRIWDLRKRKSVYIIPAHAKRISKVKFEPQEGYFLSTASFDMTAKVRFLPKYKNYCMQFSFNYLHLELGFG